jgi:hypothetical protein
MVIINTSADEVKIHAVSPLSTRGSEDAVGAVMGAFGAASKGFTSWESAELIGIVEAKSRIKIIALVCCITTNLSVG